MFYEHPHGFSSISRRQVYVIPSELAYAISLLVLDFSNFTLNSSPVCFLCDNSDCVLPTKTQNVTVDEHWWLCDEYPHCLDQTDEDNGKSDRII